MTLKTILSGYSVVIGAIGGVFLMLFGDWTVALTVLFWFPAASSAVPIPTLPLRSWPLPSTRSALVPRTS